MTRTICKICGALIKYIEDGKDEIEKGYDGCEEQTEEDLK